MFIIYDGQKLDVTAQDLAQMAETGKINADTDVSFKGAFHKAGEFKELKKIFDARKEVPKPKEDPPFNDAVPPLESKSEETEIVEVPLQKPDEIKSEEVPSVSKPPVSTVSSNKIVLFAVIPLALVVVLLLGILVGRSSQTEGKPSINEQEVSVTNVPEKPESEPEPKTKLDEETQTGLDISIKIIKDVLKNPYSAKIHLKDCLKNSVSETTYFLFTFDIKEGNNLGANVCQRYYVYLKKNKDKEKEWECPCVNIDGDDQYWIEYGFTETDNRFNWEEIVDRSIRYYRGMKISPNWRSDLCMKSLKFGKNGECISLERDVFFSSEE